MKKIAQSDERGAPDIAARLRVTGTIVNEGAGCLDSHLLRATDLVRALRGGIGRLGTTASRVAESPGTDRLEAKIAEWVTNTDRVIESLELQAPVQSDDEVASIRRTLVRSLRNCNAMAEVAGEMMQREPAQVAGGERSNLSEMVKAVRGRCSAPLSRLVSLTQIADEISQRVCHIRDALGLAADQELAWQMAAEQIIRAQIVGVGESIEDTLITSTEACAKIRDSVAKVAEASRSISADLSDTGISAKSRAVLQSLFDQLQDIETNLPWETVDVPDSDQVGSWASALRGEIVEVMPSVAMSAENDGAGKIAGDLVIVCDELQEEMTALRASIKDFTDVPLSVPGGAKIDFEQVDLGAISDMYTMNDERDIHRKAVRAASS